MKKLLLTAALAALGMLGMQSPSFAHGGQYRGPGDTVPPGGGGGGGGAGTAPGPAGPTTPGSAGPTAPGPLSPGAPGGSTASKPTTGTTTASGPDLTVWSFWWEFNKEPYLNLKSHIQEGQIESGSEGFFLGRGEKKEAKNSLRPSENQIREKVVPALLRALETETNNDIVTGAMIALAKIGDVKGESGESEFEQVIKHFLGDSNQEISETAAVALGILANPKSIPTLAALMEDTPEGRKLVGDPEVPYRTRAFAAYGLGLIGKQASAEERQTIVEHLAKTIASDNTSSRDLQIACIISMGLVPIEQMEAPVAEGEEGPQPPYLSRTAQLQFLLDFLADDTNNFLIRAHCPTALGRLLDGMPADLHETWRNKIADDLLDRMSKSSDEPREVQQSCILAMGLIGTAGDTDLDKKIRKALAEVPKNLSDQQSRNFALIAMAKVAGTPGPDGSESGIKDASEFLLKQLERGKSTIKPWAGLAIGVLGRKLKEQGTAPPELVALGDALRSALKAEKDKSRLGAYSIGVGIMGDQEASRTLLEHLEKLSEDTARGYVALGLGLMGDLNAKEPIGRIIEESKYRPDLLKQAAISLGLLGDKELVGKLVKMLQSSKSLATQAAISSALGFIGDQHSIDPLVNMLQDKELTSQARGFAAVALGIVADKEPLPWNTKIAVDLNYRASATTLVDSTNGTGILDIL